MILSFALLARNRSPSARSGGAGSSGAAQEDVRLDAAVTVSARPEESTIAAVAIRLSLVLRMSTRSQRLLASGVVAAETGPVPVLSNRSHTFSKVDRLLASRTDRHL